LAQIERLPHNHRFQRTPPLLRSAAEAGVRPKKGSQMTVQYKADFDTLEWESPIEGVRHKYIDQNNVRMRLVEYSKEMPPHWCEKGHYGYLIEGQMELEYESSKIIYKSGDGIFIPDGPDHKHRGRLISEKVLVFFIEKV
jgi:quercetin dioxygenase-like cupin family protein